MIHASVLVDPFTCSRHGGLSHNFYHLALRNHDDESLTEKLCGPSNKGIDEEDAHLAKWLMPKVSRIWIWSYLLAQEVEQAAYVFDNVSNRFYNGPTFQITYVWLCSIYESPYKIIHCAGTARASSILSQSANNVQQVYHLPTFWFFSFIKIYSILNIYWIILNNFKMIKTTSSSRIILISSFFISKSFSNFF